MTKSQREQHARDLAAEHGIEIRLTAYDLGIPVRPGDASGVAHGDFVELCIPRGWTADAYFAALHEIGHCVLGHARNGRSTRRYVADVMRAEIETWLWAAEHALELSVRARTFAVSCAATYARDYGGHGAVEELRVALNV